MRTVIAGGREVTDRAFVMKAIDSVVSERGLKISKVLSGCARGADKIGEAWAHVKGIPVKRFPADWGRFGKAAGIVRNEEMGLEAECLIAVWDGESRGTKHMINVMRRQNLPVIVIAAPAPPKFRRVRKAGVILLNEIRGKMKLIHGDCLKEMFDIPDGSVDMVLCDLPYGTTACKWDTVIPFEPLWAQYKRLIKKNGAIVLTASQPFTSALIMSNIKMFKYEWIWEKTKAGNFIQAKNNPLKLHENICIFSTGVVIHKGQSKRRMPYYPIGVKEIDKEWKRPRVYESEHNYKRPSHKTERKIKQENFPGSVIKIGSVHNPPHPTQKPVALIEYLIKTYTNEGDTVLDNCMGSGTTGVACKNLGRDFIGIELDEKYFEIAKQRIEGTQYNNQINRTQKDAPVI